MDQAQTSGTAAPSASVSNSEFELCSPDLLFPDLLASSPYTLVLPDFHIMQSAYQRPMRSMSSCDRAAELLLVGIAISTTIKGDRSAAYRSQADV